MICVSLGFESVEQMLAEHRRAAAAGAELVELRLDYLQGPFDVRQLLADRPGAAIVTCRRKDDGGRWAGTEVERQALLRAAVAAGADYVDLEEDAAAAISRSGRTRRIVSHHDLQRTPDDLETIHRRLARLDADVVKIAAMAVSPHDNLRMLQLVRKAAVRTVGFCMGEIGIISRVLAGRFGSPWSYAAPEGQAVAPGQPTFAQMKDLYRYDQIDATTGVYGVIGDPIGHSLSPRLHNTAFIARGLNKVYLPLRIPPACLPEFIDDAPELGIQGLSVTIPHKETILAKLARPDDAVKGIGAANTALFDGRDWSGFNTDYQAAMDSLEEAMENSGRQADKSLAVSPLRGKKVLVLGAGGVARAIVYGLVVRGAEVSLCDGVPARAEQLAARWKCRAVSWTDRHAAPVDVLINCTPVGMHPKVEETPFDAAHLRAAILVFDSVYIPESTRLLTEAAERGCRVVRGADMFVRQAALQFEMFTGQDSPTELMREVIRKALTEKR